MTSMRGYFRCPWYPPVSPRLDVRPPRRRPLQWPRSAAPMVPDVAAADAPPPGTPEHARPSALGSGSHAPRGPAVEPQGPSLIAGMVVTGDPDVLSVIHVLSRIILPDVGGPPQQPRDRSMTSRARLKRSSSFITVMSNGVVVVPIPCSAHVGCCRDRCACNVRRWIQPWVTRGRRR